jgi:hypothetical protein
MTEPEAHRNLVSVSPLEQSTAVLSEKSIGKSLEKYTL